MEKTKILFLCTGNSCRSQMAEGWARTLQGEHFDSYSAGIEAHGLNPRAVTVMQQAGVDISQQQSQTLDQLAQHQFDYIFTVCDRAHQSCPHFQTPTKVIHHQFDDPPALAAHARNEEEALANFCQVRDEIKHWILQLPEQLGLRAQ